MPIFFQELLNKILENKKKLSNPYLRFSLKTNLEDARICFQRPRWRSWKASHSRLVGLRLLVHGAWRKSWSRAQGRSKGRSWFVRIFLNSQLNSHPCFSICKMHAECYQCARMDYGSSCDSTHGYGVFGQKDLINGDRSLVCDTNNDLCGSSLCEVIISNIHCILIFKFYY